MKEQFKNNSKTIQKFLVIALLLTISVTGFYACKKQVPETPDPNANYVRELKTYHESQDYKNLVLQFPNQTFVDLPIFDANSKMKTIVTNIISNSGEIIRAMTYFEPEGKFNVWYPTIIVHLKSNQGKDLKEMIANNSFSGSFEFTTSDNIRINLINVVNNQSVYEDKFIYDTKVGLSRFVGSASNGKIMVADSNGEGLKECLKAADVCATKEMANMGAFSLALCVIEAYICIPALYADCFLHEKACLGVKKPLDYSTSL